MYTPFSNLDDRTLSMRDQMINRLMQLQPWQRRPYLETLKDFALIQSLELAIMSRADEYYNKRIDELVSGNF